VCGLIEDPRQGRSGKPQEFFAGFPARPGPGKNLDDLHRPSPLLRNCQSISTKQRFLAPPRFRWNEIALLERCIPADFLRSALQQHPFHYLCSLSVCQRAHFELRFLDNLCALSSRRTHPPHTYIWLMIFNSSFKLLLTVPQLSFAHHALEY